MYLPTLTTSLALASSALAAQLTQVPNYGGNARAKPGMWVYKPDTIKSSALVVAIHSCQSSAQAYFQNAKIPWKQGSDRKGYVTVWPSSTTECWDVSSRASLTHDGGGDSNAIANMIKYAIANYNIDPTKVFVTGGSSGAMMSNVLASTYPDLLTAVSLYSGVPAGCFVSSSNQAAAWNNTCSSGASTASAQAWGDVVRNMYPGYNGTRPRMQIWHGSTDATLAPRNYDETIKQWTNVFGVSTTPTKSSKDTPERNYRTDDFGGSVQGIWAQGVGHSVPSHLDVSEAWFGL
ncbi:acetylxylan esteras-like protein 1 precursor [Corynespora cassiicola Philippines]|uniref:Carboxylic ester hydrolase n=1 Tax=Corynespora cassiicola Philippines TaxID=1448308 RepID=A0A2T2NPG8_CORCC|nr:acetylxylan esteras-like protein 1 precursor [Corynespora cassiicola Philippines]